MFGHHASRSSQSCAPASALMWRTRAGSTRVSHFAAAVFRTSAVKRASSELPSNEDRPPSRSRPPQERRTGMSRHGTAFYDYRAGAVDQADNRALRAAHDLQVPLVYFVGTRPGWYRPNFPFYVIDDDPSTRQVLVAPGTMVGPMDEQEPVLPDDPIERRYAVREVRARIHQARFRGRVVPAYRGQCAICHLKEVRLLDAAHITGDLEADGEPKVSNGLALCSIHHRAFDHDLVAISPEYEVRVSTRLLQDDDGPMLELLKTFDRRPILVPRRTEWKPDRQRLATRFQRFLAAAV